VRIDILEFIELKLSRIGMYRVTQKRWHHLKLQSPVTRSKIYLFEHFKKQKNRVTLLWSCKLCHCFVSRGGSGRRLLLLLPYRAQNVPDSPEASICIKLIQLIQLIQLMVTNRAWYKRFLNEISTKIKNENVLLFTKFPLKVVHQFMYSNIFY